MGARSGGIAFHSGLTTASITAPNRVRVMFNSIIKRPSTGMAVTDIATPKKRMKPIRGTSEPLTVVSKWPCECRQAHAQQQRHGDARQRDGRN